MRNYNFFVERPVGVYNKSDFLFLVSIILLTGLGLFTLSFCSQHYAARLFSDPFYFVRRQCISIIIGILGFMFFSIIRIDLIRKILPFIVIFTLLICLLTFIPGLAIEKNGAKRWLRLPFSLSLQPSEFVKLTVVFFLANIFDKQSKREKSERNLKPAIFATLLFVVIILIQKDLSTSLFIFYVCFLLFASVGVRITWILSIAFASLPFIFIFIASEQYRLDRIIAFFHPEEGLHTFNYQSLAAKRAVSAGGFWGAGIGQNLVQSIKIPEVQTDYIFASWVESMGFFGVVIYFCIFALFIWRGFRAVLLCKDRFASYVAFGFVMMITMQSLLNLAVVCGILPSTGIPLPFFSLGGSSIISTLCMSGFVLNASHVNSDTPE